MGGPDSTQRFSDRVEGHLAGRRAIRPPSSIAWSTAAPASRRDRGRHRRRHWLSAEAVPRRWPSRHRGRTKRANACGRHGIPGALSAYSGHDGTATRRASLQASVELVIAAQAFHWFDAAASAPSRKRILRPGRLGRALI